MDTDLSGALWRMVAVTIIWRRQFNTKTSTCQPQIFEGQVQDSGATEQKIGLEIRLTDKIRPTSWDGLKIYRALSN